MRAAPSDQPQTGSGLSLGRALLAPRMLLLCWLPILLIGALHYGTDDSQAWLHNVFRRLYYLPIIVAAFHAGVGGGLSASLVVSLSYLPHAFLHIGHLAHMDPAGTWEKALEIVLYNAIGAVAGYLAGAEQRRARQLRAALDEQRRLQRQLVRAGRLGALGELVAGVSHEIKTPLHALRGTAEIVDPLIASDCPERRMWEIHMSEIERLGAIAERFRSFARPHTADLSELDLDEVASRLSDLLGSQARRDGIEVECRTVGGGAQVVGDRDQLAQVGLNIAVNAVRAIGEGGGLVRIAVVCDVELDGEPMHALRIENDGPPIAEEDLEHLFDPFVGSDPEGTGLGLSIAARIVELHGGFIEVENGGLGVIFTVYLPRAKTARPSRDRP